MNINTKKIMNRLNSFGISMKINTDKKIIKINLFITEIILE